MTVAGKPIVNDGYDATEMVLYMKGVLRFLDDIEFYIRG